MKHINIVVSKLRNCKLNGAIFFLFLAFALRLDLEGSLDEGKKKIVVMEGKATGLFAAIFDAQHNPHAKPQLWTQVTECCVK